MGAILSIAREITPIKKTYNFKMKSGMYKRSIVEWFLISFGR
jgi:hypothetical protein